MDAIDVRHLDVDRGGNRVLRDVSLSAPPGKLTGLLGPSGCGKTTLMRSVYADLSVRENLRYFALERVARAGELGSRGVLDVCVVVGVTLLALALGAATLRRRTD